MEGDVQTSGCPFNATRRALNMTDFILMIGTHVEP